jgi:hypothetical protein
MGHFRRLHTRFGMQVGDGPVLGLMLRQILFYFVCNHESGPFFYGF